MTNSLIIIYGKKSLKENNSLYVSEKDLIRPFTNHESIQLGILEINKISNFISKDKNLSKPFLYKNTSLWWLSYNAFTRNFIHITDFINNFLVLINEKKPSKIIIQDDFEKYELIKQICLVKNIELKFSKLSLSKFNLGKKNKQILKNKAANLFFKYKLKKRKRLFYNKNQSIPPTSNKILFVTYPIYRRNIFDFDDFSSKQDEFIFHNFNKFFDSEDLLGLDIFSQIRTNENSLKSRLESNIPWLPMDILINNSNSDEQKNFLENYLKLINSKEFQSLFIYKGIDYWSYIFPKFMEMKNDYYFPFWVKLLDSIEDLFKNNRPKLIFLLYETAAPSLALISICKKLGIKTIGIQHGIIHEFHPFYMHDNFSNELTSFILPDKLLLFGEITKDILLKRGYPKNKLISLGNLEFLNFKMMDDNKRNKLIENYGLSKYKIIILFAPPNLKIDKKNKINFNQKILQQLVKDFKDKTDFVVLMKPHPLDSLSEYEKLVENVNNIKIVSGNIFELILMSSIVISTYSTSILDAMALQKPVIQITFENENFPLPFDEFNCVLPANISNLWLKINQLLSDKEIHDSLIKNSTEFIKKYYNIPIENPQEKINLILND